MPYCPRCGSQNEADAAFCGACGTRIEGVAPSPPPTAGPPAQGRANHWPVIGGIVALVAIVVGGVLLYSAVTNDDGGRDSLLGADGEEATPTALSPTREATLAPTRPAAPTLTPEPLPTDEPTLVPPVQGFATPEDAIAAFLQEYGLTYVGDCETASIETDIGSYCSMLWEDQFDTRIYLAGLTFSEADTWLLVSRLGARDDWMVVDLAPVGPLEEELVPPWP